ncbi:GrpB family protein [uncultured Tateyamaria sp.]|uniref:GrpB family protein n=1 Tax=uncultured Tateyamaria sp. TaxID=455651 RepID=UPI00260BC107|nr:GrpB family protein [uncultured Tateyamaria sp.]
MSLLVAYDDSWPAMAAAEAARWRTHVAGLVTVHHIGSTAVPGLPAKPIIDLIPVFADDASADAARPALEDMGYEWMGAFGLPGRRYCRRFDPESGHRLVHAHAYVQGHADIRRHLAFRDALRNNTALRVAYASVKGACAARHPEGGADYGVCKSGWIAKTEARALERYQ